MQGFDDWSALALMLHRAEVHRMDVVDRVLPSRAEGLDDSARFALHVFAQYFMIDLMELGEVCARRVGATVLLPRHIEQAVIEDEEIRTLLSGRVCVERWSRFLEERRGLCEEARECEERGVLTAGSIKVGDICGIGLCTRTLHKEPREGAAIVKRLEGGRGLQSEFQVKALGSEDWVHVCDCFRRVGWMRLPREIRYHPSGLCTEDEETFMEEWLKECGGMRMKGRRFQESEELKFQSFKVGDVFRIGPFTRTLREDHDDAAAIVEELSSSCGLRSGFKVKRFFSEQTRPTHVPGRIADVSPIQTLFTEKPLHFKPRPQPAATRQFLHDRSSIIVVFPQCPRKRSNSKDIPHLETLKL
jgi:hypothetical protein